jgi:hypothetical protein
MKVVCSYEEQIQRCILFAAMVLLDQKDLWLIELGSVLLTCETPIFETRSGEAKTK